MYFVINKCEFKGCLHWRLGDKCNKHGKAIALQVKYIANMHDSSVCEVRRQADKFRLNEMLEK